MFALAKNALCRRQNYNWSGDPYTGGNGNQRQNQEKILAALYTRRIGAYVSFPLVHQPRSRVFGYPRTPIPRPAYNRYSGSIRRPPFSPMNLGYRMRSPAYRSPYMRYGYRSRPSYARSPWNARA